MRILFEKLRDAGFHVDATKESVEIHGTEPFPYTEVLTILRRFGLTDSQTDQVLGDLASTVELHQIFNALR